MAYTPTVGEFNKRLQRYFAVRDYLKKGYPVKHIAAIMGVSTQAIYAILNSGPPWPRKWDYEKWLSAKSCKKCDRKAVAKGLCLWHYAIAIGALETQDVQAESSTLVVGPEVKRGAKKKPEN